MVGAIPARYASVRLPGKPLRLLAGRPIIEHVYRRAAQASSLSRVVVLTDDERIATAVTAFGGKCEMTPVDCASGTDRIAHAARGWDAAAVVNIQGDEPMIEPTVIERVAQHLRDHRSDGMVTLASPLSDEDFDNPNVVKVVRNRQGYALYFSRAAIPHPRRADAAPRLQHIGIYGYRTELLLELAGLEPTPLELNESLEQLRALEHGIPIRVLDAARCEPGIDTPEDLARSEARLQASIHEGNGL
ncbi:MAG: 3-deoxy-manno-octulosonate cytidylyltransferase [Acidobacteriota bacterium]